MLVIFSGERWDDELARGVFEHLRAGLGPAGFAVCSGAAPGAKAPTATVELRMNGGERVAATIEVKDGVTRKRVARDIELSELPADGRALGVGVAADELIRASWVELTLKDAPRSAEPPPPAVERAVATALRPDTPRNRLTLRGAADGFAGGTTLVGGDLALSHLMNDHVGFELGLVLRRASSVPSTHGEITGSAIGAELMLVADLARAGGFSLRGEAGATALEVRLSGTPRPGTVVDGGSEVAVVPRVGVGLAYQRGAFVLALRGAATVAARGVNARDEGATATGVSGFGWSAALGPGLVF